MSSSQQAALPRAIIRVRHSWPSFKLIMARLKQAVIVLAVTAGIAAAVALFGFMASGLRHAAGERVQARYALQRHACWQSGGDATTLRQEFRGPFIVECWVGNRLLYTTDFPHPFDE